jgi:hypothetical protein
MMFAILERLRMFAMRLGYRWRQDIRGGLEYLGHERSGL